MNEMTYKELEEKWEHFDGIHATEAEWRQIYKELNEVARSDEYKKGIREGSIPRINALESIYMASSGRYDYDE